MKKHETARIICENIAALQGQRLRGHGPGSAETRFAPGVWEGMGQAWSGEDLGINTKKLPGARGITGE